ncbi:hypothetical protein H5410_056407 [Solanum commersonii]|uniref:Uncharacterized protein n=1 Tax=Solanum commersonii TaxID=4109 RepID=A0A9J5WK61_SOLCO|nr:hypothetical protein H5410_056407 [Solanum commersonii]
MKGSSWHVAEQFREAAPYLPMIQNANMSSWVQLEGMNPRPSPTHLARESEWAKAKVVFNCCNSVFKRN